MPDSNIRIRIDGAAAAAGADRAKRALQEIDNVARKTNADVDKLSQELNKVAQEAQSTATGLNNANKSITATGREAKKATTEVDKLGTEFTQAEAQATNTVSSVNTLARVLSTIGAGVTLNYAFQTLSDFEQSMSTVRAITRATGPEFDALREKAKELGATTRFSANEAADALRFLGQAGFNTTEILASSAAVLSLAQAGGLGLADAAEISSKALRSFQIDASRMNEVADIMAKVFTVSNTNVQELGEAFRYVAPVATGLGVSMKDTTAAIAALSDAGISASMAGTSLRGIMTRLVSPTAASKKMLEEAGLTTDKLDIKTRGLIPVLQDLARAGLTTGQAMEIFGDRAGPGFEVISAAIPKLLKLSETLGNVEGFAQETAKIMDDNLQGSFKNLQSAIDNFIISGAETTGFLDGMRGGIDGVTSAINSFVSSGMFEYVDEIITAIVTYIAYTKAMALWTNTSTGALIFQGNTLQALVGRYGVAGAAQQIFAAGMATATAGVRAFSASLVTLAANPVFWVAAIGAGLYTIYQQFQEAEEQTNSLRDSFINANAEAKKVSAEAKALQETAARTELTKAQANVANATQVANEQIDKLSSNIFGLQIDYEFAFTGIENRLITFKERIFGINDTTVETADKIRGMYAAIGNADTALNKINAVNKALSEIEKMIAAQPDNQIFKEIQRDLQSIGGTLQNLNTAQEALATAEQGVSKIGNAAVDVNLQLKQLDDLMKEIGKSPIINPSNATEALTWLMEWTDGTDVAKQEQYALELQTAATSFEILQQAAALALAQGRLDDFGKITARTVALMARASQMKPPKSSDGGSSRGSGGGGQNSAEKFKQSALDKIKELQFKILETEAELTGESEKQLEVLRLRTQQTKELEDLRRRAAEAGMLDSAELKQAEELTNKLYGMKIAVKEYEAQWDKARKPMEAHVSVMDVLGASINTMSLRLKEMQYLQVQADPSLGAEEKVRRLAVVNAELIKMRDAVYGLNKGEQIGIAAQMQGITEAVNQGAIPLDTYNAKMLQLKLNLAQLKQDAGDATFMENVSLSLGGIVENYKGLTAGLTESFGSFFTSFTQGFADSIGRAIVYSEDLGTALHNVAQQVLSSLISALIQLGIQWVIMQTIGTSLAATQTAAMTAMASALTAAWAPAATLASIATFGGAAAAGAAGIAGAMVSTTAITSAMQAAGGAGGGVPGFAKGGVAKDWAIVGEEGPELVNFSNPGRVYTAAETASALNTTSRSSMAPAYADNGDFYGGGVNIYVSVEYYGSQNVDFQVDKLDENRVRIIAREVASETVRKEAPSVIASDYSNSNSATAKSWNQNSRTQRRHGY